MALGVVVMFACSGAVEGPVTNPPAPAPTPAPAPEAPAPDRGKAKAGDGEDPPFEGTIGIVDQPSKATGTVLLKNLRTVSKDRFDRVVFELEGGVPGYHLEYVDKPVRHCASGEPLPVAGDAWLEVRLSPAAAHSEDGKATLGFQEQALSLPIVKELQQTCDFEGQVTWVIGVGSPNAYRVLEKADPTRLVVDIER